MMETLMFTLSITTMALCIAIFVKMIRLTKSNTTIATGQPTTTEINITNLRNFPIRFENIPPNNLGKPISMSVNMLPPAIISNLLKLADGKRYAILDMRNIDADLIKYTNGLYGTPMINAKGKIVAHAGMEIISQQTIALAACYSILSALTSTYHLYKIKTELCEIKESINNLITMERNSHIAVIYTGICYQSNISFWMDDNLIKLHFNDLQKEYYFHRLQIDYFLNSINPSSKDAKNDLKKNITTRLTWHIAALENIILLIINISRQKTCKIELVESDITENISNIVSKLSEYEALFVGKAQKTNVTAEKCKSFMQKLIKSFIKRDNDLSEQDVINELTTIIDSLTAIKLSVETNEPQNEIYFDLVPFGTS